jgi:hypothetical protein
MKQPSPLVRHISTDMYINYENALSQDSIAGIVTMAQSGKPKNCGSIPARARHFLLLQSCWAVGSIKPPIQWN